MEIDQLELRCLNGLGVFHTSQTVQKSMLITDCTGLNIHIMYTQLGGRCFHGSATIDNEVTTSPPSYAHCSNILLL